VIEAAIAAAVSAVVVAAIARWPGLAPQDRPNDRSLHDRPVPRAGGWAILAGWAAAAPIAGLPPGFSASSFATLLVALAALVAISLVDDYRGVAPAWRMLVQSGGALAVAIALSGPLGAGVPVVAAIAFVLVGATNGFNFMDGSDGLAGAMTAIGFSAYAAAAALGGAPYACWLAVACAAIPFLARNLPPARLFLGDAGSVPLGFLAGAAGVAGAAAGAWPAWFPLVVFLPFLADAGITLARRALRGERVWEAHRTHYYQRLVRLGAGHRGTLLVYGTLMLGCAASAVACAALAPAAGWALLAGWFAIVIVVFARIDYHVGIRG
jgi:UDP-N-acetylmuramyl pentapeptide phosphotransferase/UDP-N-acetylglucosamine-1-phosphate transferase